MGEYYRCDIANVLQASVGGRMYSVRCPKEMPNGMFCTLGDYEEGSTEIRKMLLPREGTTEIAIIHKPEINYDERFSSDNAIGIFRNEEDAVVPAVILSNHDGIDLSRDYFPTGEEPQVEDWYRIVENNTVGGQLDKADVDILGPSKKGVYFKVIGIKPSCIANFVVSKDSKLPTTYNMIQLEVVIMNTDRTL